MNNLAILGIIPARAGSKGVPGKNIRPVAGKPLVAYTIDAALKSKSINRLIISTDSREIADLASQYGAEAPYLRPAEISQDDTPGMEPVIHTLEWLNTQENYRPDYVMVLQPTSPLRNAFDIETAIQLAMDKNADGVVSVTPVENHPYWMKSIQSDGKLTDFLPQEDTYLRRQDLPPIYALNGAIYLARRENLLTQRTFFIPEPYAYVMPRERSIDIDTSWDLYLADLIIRERIKNEAH